MRRLPIKPNQKQRKNISACQDFFGSGASQTEKTQAKRLALWLLNRRKGLLLSEEEQNALFFIKNNLASQNLPSPPLESSPGTF